MRQNRARGLTVLSSFPQPSHGFGGAMTPHRRSFRTAFFAALGHSSPLTCSLPTRLQRWRRRLEPAITIRARLRRAKELGPTLSLTTHLQRSPVSSPLALYVITKSFVPMMPRRKPTTARLTHLDLGNPLAGTPPKLEAIIVIAVHTIRPGSTRKRFTAASHCANTIRHKHSLHV